MGVTNIERIKALINGYEEPDFVTDWGEIPFVINNNKNEYAARGVFTFGNIQLIPVELYERDCVEYIEGIQVDDEGHFVRYLTLGYRKY